jgi:hypothetical protein
MSRWQLFDRITTSLCTEIFYSITSLARNRELLGQIEGECLGGLEIDHKIEFSELLHRKVSWLLAVDDAPKVSADLSNKVCKARSITRQIGSGCSG